MIHPRVQNRTPRQRKKLSGRRSLQVIGPLLALSSTVVQTLWLNSTWESPSRKACQAHPTPSSVRVWSWAIKLVKALRRIITKRRYNRFKLKPWSWIEYCSETAIRRLCQKWLHRSSRVNGWWISARCSLSSQTIFQVTITCQTVPNQSTKSTNGRRYALMKTLMLGPRRTSGSSSYRNCKLSTRCPISIFWKAQEWRRSGNLRQRSSSKALNTLWAAGQATR